MALSVSRRLSKSELAPLAALVLYASLLGVVMFFHEPWFDEAESWLIARDAAYREILFTIPHYEGHPPFWWLLLSIPAKLRLPYELSIKTINAVFSIFAAALLLFKAPFPTWIRCALPFSYFLFYQYGVQSRPYSIMTCAVFLAAVTWAQRDLHPFRFSLTLLLLCSTSAYGIIIAGGIALAWTIELLKKHELLRIDRRFFSLLLLFVSALTLILLILPRDDTYASARTIYGETNTQLQRIYYAFFCLPSEAAVTSYGADTLFHYFQPDLRRTAVMTIVSLVIWTGLLRFAHKGGTTLYLVLPAFLFLAFSALTYFSMHHLGILYLLFLFSLWISWGPNSVQDSLLRNQPVSVFLTAGIAVSLLITCIWSVIASVREVNNDFSMGRALAAFVQDNQLQKYRWSACWRWKTDDNDMSVVLYENTHEVVGAVVEANPYLEQPLLGGILSGKSYIDHVLPSREQMEKEKAALEARGTDIIVGMPLGENARKRLRISNDFTVLTQLESGHIWKTHKEWDIVFVCGSPEIHEQILENGKEK